MRGVVKHGNLARAAKDAGYADKKQGWRLYHERPHVRELIDKVRDSAMKEAEYDLLSVIEEGERLMKIAVDAKQHTAAANYYKTLTTIRGFLDRRYIHEHFHNHTIDLQMALEDARTRAMLPVEYPDETAIEAEYKLEDSTEKLEATPEPEGNIEDLLD